MAGAQGRHFGYYRFRSHPTYHNRKKPDPSFWETLDGYPAVGTHLPSFMHAADRHEMKLLKLVEKMTLNPACIFGLYPRKGTLMPGIDADVVIFDSELKQTVDSKRDGSRADFALHQNEMLKGWPIKVIKGGHLYSCDSTAGAVPRGSGSYLRRDLF